MSMRALILQAHQVVDDEIRRESESMGEGGRYCQQ